MYTVNAAHVMQCYAIYQVEENCLLKEEQTGEEGYLEKGVKEVHGSCLKIQWMFIINAQFRQESSKRECEC